VLLDDDAGNPLGSLPPLDTTAGGGLSKVGQVMSYCTRFDGSYRDGQGQVRAACAAMVAW
jgi:hypothetical protein